MERNETAGLAEQHVLGGILRWPAVLDDVAGFLEPRHFGQAAHAEIFRLMLKLWTADKPVDISTVLQSSVDPKAAFGGKEYLETLFDNQPTGALAVYHAKAVHAAGIHRALGYALAECQKDVGEHFGEVGPLVESVERRILAVGEDRPVDDVALSQAANDAMEDINARSARGKLPGVPSGFADLDEITCGFPAGGLVLVAARPSVGKTAFAANVALNTARAGYGILFISLEQSRIELAERMLCGDAEVNSHRVRMGWVNREEAVKLRSAEEGLRALPFFINDNGSQTVVRIASVARRQRRRNKIALVVVDYLQLIDSVDKRMPRQEQVSSISRALKSLARELSIPVMCLAQLNRDLEKRKDHKPVMADLRESGALEQDADQILLLHRPELYEGKEGEAEVIVAKHRNGRTGSATLQFSKAHMRFTSLAPNLAQVMA